MRTLALLILAACPSAKAPPAVEPPAKPAVPVVLEWTRSEWPELGLGFASFAGMEINKTEWHPGGVAGQGIVRGDERVRWLIRTRVGESFEGFLLDHADWTITPSTATVCGHEVPRLVATHADQDIACVITATDSYPAWIPPRRSVAVQYVTKHGVPVVAVFDIESATIDAWLAAEAQFIAALSCP